MNHRAKESLWTLTEKEKQTLRLIVRGHDAKSTARTLGLSVHTINERLRDARHKLEVSSSREAARLLFEAEGGASGPTSPDFLVDTEIGEAAIPSPVDQGTAPSGVERANRHPWIIGGLLMTIALGLLALVALPNIDSTSSQTPSNSPATPNAQVVDSARQWLTLVDQGRWEESYQATGKSFRKQNSVQLWAATSEQVRRPLGAVISRTFISQETVAAPPHGYDVVKFRTFFANKAEMIEAVTLDRQDGIWRVVGISIGE